MPIQLMLWFLVMDRLTKEHIQVCLKFIALLQSIAFELKGLIVLLHCWFFCRPCVRLLPNQVKMSSKALEELAKRFVVDIIVLNCQNSGFVYHLQFSPLSSASVFGWKVGRTRIVPKGQLAEMLMAVRSCCSNGTFPVI